MPKERKIVPILINAAIFILMEIAAINMLRKNDSLQNIWFARGAHHIMGAFWGGSENLKHYFSLKKENQELAAENFNLRNELLRLQSGKNDAYADSLSKSIDFLFHIKNFSYIPAEVVKISRNKQHNYLIINKGSEDGVVSNSGIVTGQGVVGVIDVVGKHYSYALSLMNQDISVSARVGGEGAVGSLMWTGTGAEKGIVRDLPLHFDYQEGDTVYTSGFSTIFPPDIPLGTAGKSRIVDGSANEVKVNLFQDFSAIRYVTVVNNLSKDEIKDLER